MLDIVIKGIQILQALYNLREELEEKKIIEVVRIFAKEQEWKDRLSFSSRPGSVLPNVRHVFSAAESSINRLVKLLEGNPLLKIKILETID
jgi:hypothetical protein